MIHLNNVTKMYPNGSIGVENVNLHIEKGEFVFIVRNLFFHYGDFIVSKRSHFCKSANCLNRFS